MADARPSAAPDTCGRPIFLLLPSLPCKLTSGHADDVFALRVTVACRAQAFRHAGGGGWF